MSDYRHQRSCSESNFFDRKQKNEVKSGTAPFGGIQIARFFFIFTLPRHTRTLSLAHTHTRTRTHANAHIQTHLIPYDQIQKSSRIKVFWGWMTAAAETIKKLLNKVRGNLEHVWANSINFASLALFSGDC